MMRRDGGRPSRFARVLPILDWGAGYRRGTFGSDLVAAMIVTIMLIPQSLAYAMLAGLPPEVGLYASILPLVAYALFGTSRTLAVGPVAVVSLMTAAAIGNLGLETMAQKVEAAAVLACLSGAMLVAMGALRLGFLANFLSHPVISGFITAAGILIAASQLKHILGVGAGGETLVEIATSLARNVGDTNPITLAIGMGAAAFLVWVRRGLKPLLARAGVPRRAAEIAARAAPIAAVAVTILLAWGLALGERGVALVGAVPEGLPPIGVPALDLPLWMALALPAFLVSLVGFVESVSVAQTLAARRRQRIVPDQELIGLGAANVASAVSGGFPVSGGFARSVVNFDAGAETPAAGAFAAVGIALATLVLTPYLAYLPTATLAATIIVAVLSLVDFGELKRTWVYSRADFAAVATTIVLTLAVGVEAGIAAGVAISIVLLLLRTSRPHIAVVGLVPGTEHFRNVKRHCVITTPDILSIRVDESLYFANGRFLEDFVTARVAGDERIRHVVLMCSAVNEIDSSALASLEAINHRLESAGVTFHLSEVKGPVMDRLKRTDFLSALTGHVFLSQFEAATALDPTLATPAPEPALNPPRSRAV